MFSSIKERRLPDGALLQRYADSDDYTDGFATDISGSVTLAQYVAAFYTTPVFRAERLILKWLASRPSTDEEARQLAVGPLDSFAAWHVEDRSENQLLLTDYRGRTRSWLMVDKLGDATGAHTRLYFGSAVIRTDDAATGRHVMAPAFRALLGFHRLYSRILLAAARSRLPA